MEKQASYEKIKRSAAARTRVRTTVTYVLLTIWGLIVLFPFYWMILTSRWRVIS